MDDEVRALLREAAPTTTAELDFDRLWADGRRRRRLGYASGAATLVVAFGVAALVVAPFGQNRPDGVEVADRPPSHCSVTDVEAQAFTPPDPFPQQPEITGGVWYGSDELWTVVVPDGPDPARSLWWSTNYQGGVEEPRPDIEVVYESLDNNAIESLVLDETTHVLGDADADFMIAGMGPTQPGCWRVTATYGDAELTLVIDVPD